MSSPPPTAAPLPSHLQERLRPLNHRKSPVTDGEFVLYWTHHALRSHDNPALDAACTIAHALDKPLLVYQGLGGRHRFNSDRHHRFILEGARDLHRQLAEKNLRHVCYLGANPNAKTPLHRLAQRAALVVVEDFPVPPFVAWTDALAKQAPCPVWALDCACVVPMKSVGKAIDRAFAFRDKHQKDFFKRLPQPWPEFDADVRPFDGDLGFDPIDWRTADLGDLCAQCAIPHDIGPVPHTVGGSTAGYHRWQTFKTQGLTRYAKLRNDAAIDWPQGVSRLSPYLHYGMVSPLRIAREAWEVGGDGAEKFLDELFVWRELAHNLCFYHRDLESLRILPKWAADTLRVHAKDPRPHVFDDETFWRGRTGDPLWDAAQHSLLIHGELHNNVRMTWGKQLLEWTRDAPHALQQLIDLNHRYALDGNDPNSYGGLLWCLGLFDRPFAPEQPILGTVRGRSTAEHAQRLKLNRYVAKTQRCAGQPLRIAVIGAGLAGTICSRLLRDHGHTVTLFEKSRGAGGRMSTRRTDAGQFDHGAQYFTANDPRFQRYVTAWQQQGLVVPWDGRILGDRGPSRPRYVAVPAMNQLCKQLASGVTVHWETAITAIHPTTEGRDGPPWVLMDGEAQRHGPFDAVLTAIPAAQTAALLQTVAPTLADAAATVAMLPNWTVMAQFAAPLPTAFDGHFVREEDDATPRALAWAARDSSKAGRQARAGSLSGDNWVLQAHALWTAAHLDDDKAAVIAALLADFWAIAGVDAAEPLFADAHRWLYARVDQPLDRDCLWDPALGLGAAGDWCLGAKVEAAFLSGTALAGRVLQAVAADDQPNQRTLGV